MSIKIVPLEETHISELAPLFPKEWDFDFRKFTKTHSRNTYVLYNKNRMLSGFFINALEAGAVISNNNLAGIELLKLKLKLGNTKIAIPTFNESVKDFLLENGFSKQYALPKMILGKKYSWQPEFIFNRGAGYCG